VLGHDAGNVEAPGAALVQSGSSGKLGRRGLGYLLLFQVLLPLLAPVVDVFVVYGLIFLHPVPILGVWLGFLLLQLGMGLYAFRLDGERPTVELSAAAARLPAADVSRGHPVGLDRAGWLTPATLTIAAGGSACDTSDGHRARPLEPASHRACS
jgi:hypothetical protein